MTTEKNQTDRRILSCDAINAQPVDFDWDGDTYGEKWDTVRPDPSDWSLEKCRNYLDNQGCDFPDPDPFGIDDVGDLFALAGDLLIDGFDGPEEDGGAPTLPDGVEYTAESIRAAIVSAIDEEEVDGIEVWRDCVRDHDNDCDDYTPMMSYYYPLPGLRMSAEDAQEAVRDTACIVALVDGEPVLALAGGGMDLSPSICEAYVNLGYYPPLHYAENLPRLGKGYGHGMTAEVVSAALESARIAERWAADARERLEAFARQFNA